MTVQPISYSSDSYEDAIINDTNSIMKNILDTWYKNNLINYASYLADETFCNDRSIINGTGYLLNSRTDYGGYYRLQDSKTPILKCMQDSDKFKLSNENAKLDYPIALITADEVALAGGRGYYMGAYSPNSSYYLYNGQIYWTMTPSYFYNGTSNSRVWDILENGSLSSWRSVDFSSGVRPVINLRSDVQITKGDGTALNPYVVKS